MNEKILQLINSSLEATSNKEKLNILTKAQNLIYQTNELSYTAKINYLKKIEEVSKKMNLPT
ncbi:MAG: hypothetical protein ACLSGH_10345 [Faecalibacillus intestinalis]|uniref:hypothetical protein n=1 Tax=Faecalibacillus intestinalis TaxID=1982626 RepID=UPI000E48F0DF|nr:hypothetical protein DWX19_09125 [Coprobacillus sp. AF18-40]